MLNMTLFWTTQILWSNPYFSTLKNEIEDVDDNHQKLKYL